MKWKTKIFVALTVPVVVLSGNLAAHADLITYSIGPQTIIIPAFLAGLISIITMIITAIILVLRRFMRKNKSWLRNENDFKLVKDRKNI